MLSVLSHLTYRRLFFAQVVALLGTGLTTIALGLLAYELAGAQAGAVLGTALAINVSVAAASAVVIINTVVYVQSQFALSHACCRLSFGSTLCSRLRGSNVPLALKPPRGGAII